MDTEIIKEYKYEFSIIMAVYNCELFLRETLDSVLAQDFNFEDYVQLILVDDGSTDKSGLICDEYGERYSNNIKVIHKKNGGVASARNEGLKYAEGRYINFMDSDDIFTENVLSSVYEFFRENEEKTDVVTIPLEFFDAQKGPHWQNGKFNSGDRIIDLWHEYNATIMFVNASFFTNRCIEKINFDSHLVCGEDIKVLLEVLSEKMRLGVVSTCKYMYRRRSAGEESLIQSAKKKKGWYFDYFTYLVDWAFDFFNKKYNFIPGYVQYIIACDLQWRFREIYDMTEVLTEDEIEKYKEILFNSLKNIEDKYILEQKMIWNEHKVYMLSKKYNCEPLYNVYEDDIELCYKNTRVTWLSQNYTFIDFIKFDHGVLSIEGYTMLMGYKEDKVNVYLQVDDELYKCNLSNRDMNQYRFEEIMFRGIAFNGKINLNKLTGKEHKIKIVCEVKGHFIVKKDIRFSKFSPIGNLYKNAYYYNDNWVLKFKGYEFYINKCNNIITKAKYEIKFLCELLKRHKKADLKAIIARIVYKIISVFKSREIWLISDRVDRAGDNGEALFQYINKIKPKNVKVYFLLSKTSNDITRIKDISKNVVNYFSLKHKLLHLLSTRIISSQADDFIINPFKSLLEPYRDLMQKQKFVFLQHGVTKDDISKWFNKYKINAKLFVTTAKPEYKSLHEYNYYYNCNEVQLLGFPRYDKLYDNDKKYITIMPTWRGYLVTGFNSKTGTRNLKNNFKNTSYYKNYYKLLSDIELINYLKDKGYKLRFVIHPNMSDSFSYFSNLDNVDVINGEISYTEIFAESSLIITDYSSVAFDFAYLRKPTIYYQFDKEEFFSGSHTYTKGYFDYERDGFGEVELTLDDTVNRIIEYVENDCRLKEKYRTRIDNFFMFNDKDNCKRVYNAIRKI